MTFIVGKFSSCFINTNLVTLKAEDLTALRMCMFLVNIASLVGDR